MRLSLSIVLAFLGLTSVYLFASEAVTNLTFDIVGLEAAVEKALRPFVNADLVSTLVLTLGMACFAAGILVAPRSDVWIAFSDDGENPMLEKRVLSYSKAVSREKIFELALAFNGLVVVGIMVLIGFSIVQPTPPRVLGALYIAAALEAILGTGILVYVLVKGRHVATKKFRPLLAAAAGLNILEVAALAGILVFGYLDS